MKKVIPRGGTRDRAAALLMAWSLLLVLSWFVLQPTPALASPDMTPRVALTSSQRQWLEAHPVLIVGWVDEGWPPRPSGLPADIPTDAGYGVLQLAASRLGVEVRPRAYHDWPALMRAACAGDVDVVSGVTLTADRTLCMVFTAEYAEVPFALVSRQQDTRLDVDTNLRGLRLLTVEGDAAAAIARLRYPEAIHRTVASPLEALQQVDGMQADVFLGDGYRASHLIEEEALSNLVLHRPAVLGTMGLHLATPNNRQALAEALDAAMQTITLQERTRLFSGYFKPIQWHDRAQLMLSNAERDVLARPLRVGYPAAWSPLAFVQHGEISGLAGDYLRRLRLTGADLQEDALGWEQLRDAMRQGRVDAVIGVPEEFEGLDAGWVISQPFISIANVIVTRRESGVVLGLSDLRGQAVALVRGRGIAPYLTAAAQSVRIIPVDDPRAGLDMVLKGKADAYIGNLAVVDALMRDEYAGALHVAAPAGIEDRLVLAVKQPHGALAGVFDRLLLTMPAREREVMRNGWLSQKESTSASLWKIARWAAPVLLALLLLLLVHGYGYLRLHREVAERRQVERRLAEVTDNLPAVVYQVLREPDGQLRFTFTAGDTYSLFGISREDVMRDEANLFNQVHPDDQPVVREAIREAAEQLKFIDFEFRVRHGDGWRWVRSRGQPVLTADQTLKWSGYWIDVTQMREQALALAAAREAAEDAALAKTTFLATMSHEIRTPMSGILGMLEVLEHSRLDEEQENILAIINDAAQMLRQILDDILDFSKIDAGALSLELTPVSLRSIVGNVQRMLSPLATEKGLALEAHVDERIDGAHLADGVRLRQILFNLLSNALKFTEHGRIGLELLLVEDRPTAQRMKISVVDTGIGISPEQRDTLFRPFSQAEASTSRRYGGTGLGLSICTRLAELMGGHLTLHSVPGCGTRVEFEVTLSREDSSLLALKTSAAIEADSQVSAELRQHRVLIVEDHPTNQALMVWRMQQLDMEYELARDGRHALARLEDGDFDLVITDCQMPVMDGYTLAREIRQREQVHTLPRMPIIALTANVLQEERERCRVAGMDAFLTKPVSLARLRDCLISLLVPSAAVARDDAFDLSTGSADPLPDRAGMLAMFGSEDVLIQIINSLVTSTTEDLAAIEQGMAAADRGLILDRVHRIAGGVAVTGAEQLAQRARELMAQLDDDMHPTIPEDALHAFIASVRRYLARLQPS